MVDAIIMIYVVDMYIRKIRKKFRLLSLIVVFVIVLLYFIPIHQLHSFLSKFNYLFYLIPLAIAIIVDYILGQKEEKNYIKNTDYLCNRIIAERIYRREQSEYSKKLDEARNALISLLYLGHINATLYEKLENRVLKYIDKVKRPETEDLTNAQTLNYLLNAVTELIAVYNKTYPLLYMDINTVKKRTSKYLFAADGWEKHHPYIRETSRGGYFAIFLFRRRVKKMFDLILRTCYFSLAYETNSKNTCILHKIIDKVTKSKDTFSGKELEKSHKIDFALRLTEILLPIVIPLIVSTIFLTYLGQIISDILHTMLSIRLQDIGYIIYTLVFIGYSIAIGPYLLNVRKWYMKMVYINKVENKEIDISYYLVRLQRFVISHTYILESDEYKKVTQDKYKFDYLPQKTTEALSALRDEGFDIGLAENFDKLPESIRKSFVLEIDRGTKPKRALPYVLAENFDKLSDKAIADKAIDILFKLKYDYKVVGTLADDVADNFHRLPENVQNLLFDLADNKKTAIVVAYAVAHNFHRLPENFRNELLLKLADNKNTKDQIVRAIAKVHHDYRMLPDSVKRELRHKVKAIRRPPFLLDLLRVRISGK